MATGPAAVIYKHFESLTDPRADRGKNHSLVEMVFLALTATICGAQGWADAEHFAKSKLAWFLQFICLEHGVPNHDTFGRLFARLDTDLPDAPPVDLIGCTLWTRLRSFCWIGMLSAAAHGSF